MDAVRGDRTTRTDAKGTLMTSRFLVFAGLLGLGLMTGYVLWGSSAAESEPPATASQPDGRGAHPELGSGAALRTQVADLRNQISEQAKEVERLTSALANSRTEADQLRVELSAAAEDPSSPDAIRHRILRHYFDPHGWDFDRAVAGLRSVSSRLERDALVVHDNDFAPFMKAVWAAKLANAAGHGIQVPREDAAAIESIMIEQAQRYRRYMYEEYRPKLEAATTREEIEAARSEQGVRFAQFLGGMSHGVMVHLSKRPGGRELFEQLTPYL